MLMDLMNLIAMTTIKVMQGGPLTSGSFSIPKTKRMRGGGDGKAEKPKPG